jgi:hypothetical protein
MKLPSAYFCIAKNSLYDQDRAHLLRCVGPTAELFPALEMLFASTHPSMNYEIYDLDQRVEHFRNLKRHEKSAAIEL